MASGIAQFFAVSVVLLAAADVFAGQAPPVTRQTVCGKVQKVTCDEKPPRFTTLELKPKSKNLPVTILPASRAQFAPAPEEMYRNTEVCATGHVEIYSGHRRLVVSGSQDITIKTRVRLLKSGGWGRTSGNATRVSRSPSSRWRYSQTIRRLRTSCVVGRPREQVG